MICVDDMAKRIGQLEDIGVRALAVHTGVDQQLLGGEVRFGLRQMIIAHVDDGGLSGSFLDDKTRLGRTAGVGVEHMFDPHWTLRGVVLDIRDRGNGFTNGTGDPVAPLDPAFSATDGMGMGLMLANATIERLGGSVHITDRDGGGAWVRVTLPFVTQTGAQA